MEAQKYKIGKGTKRITTAIVIPSYITIDNVLELKELLQEHLKATYSDALNYSYVIIEFDKYQVMIHGNEYVDLARIELEIKEKRTCRILDYLKL